MSVMTKAELIAAMSDLPDDAEIYLNTAVYKDHPDHHEIETELRTVEIVPPSDDPDEGTKFTACLCDTTQEERSMSTREIFERRDMERRGQQ